MLYGVVIFAGRPAVVVPITGLTPRGVISLPIDFHSELFVPSDMMACSPLRVATMVRGVEMAKLALNGIGGKLILSTTASWFRSMMLMLSPPVLATYSVPPSGDKASERGSWPTLIGERNCLAGVSKTSTRFRPELAM